MTDLFDPSTGRRQYRETGSGDPLISEVERRLGDRRVGRFDRRHGAKDRRAALRMRGPFGKLVEWLRATQ